MMIREGGGGEGGAREGKPHVKRMERRSAVLAEGTKKMENDEQTMA
jgi:hypothetical protein